AYVRSKRETDEVRAERTREVEAFARKVAELMALGSQARQLRQRALTESDDAFREHLVMLQQYAAKGREYEHHERAVSVLERVGECRGVSLRGKHELRALNLLVSLGVWGEHEILAVHRARFPTSFDEATRAEAERVVAEPWEPEGWRRDLTDITCFAIDDPGTQDIDDALSCYPRLEGGWTVGIHIADAGAWAELEGALDGAARERATSIYLPTGVLSMFPERLSMGRMSLHAGELRPAISTLVHFDAGLEVEDHEIVPSVVRISHAVTYDEVESYLNETLPSPAGVMLRDLAYIASELFHQRLNKGAVNFDIPEPKVRVRFAQDGSPRVSVHTVDPRAASRTLVSELMILNGALMGAFCTEHRLPVLYRGQLAPEESVSDEHFQDYPEGLSRTFAKLRRMRRGEVSTRPMRHFALGLERYVQATSPIRRYSDVVCQHQVKAHLLGRALPMSREQVEQIAWQVESTTGDAMTIERETRSYWTLYYLSQHVHDVHRGVVLDYASHRRDVANVFLVDLGYTARRVKLESTPERGVEIELMVHLAEPRLEKLVLREV
ncbi:MAG: RNB domain-containing ribonuclease, partial [Myxococcota bacterium]